VPSSRTKKTPRLPVIRGRVWVEIGGASAITEAGSDLIEQIEACGSLSEAARRLGFSYRRAWLLMDSMNRLWSEPVIRTATGGARGGGARVTEFGRELLSSYRDLQLQMEHLLDRATPAFRTATRPIVR
jgi:molybdate transport system regulatory protein